jgi:hypothetical protein
MCISKTFHYCGKCPSEQLKRRKDLFWFTVSKSSVHDWFTPLLRVCHETEDNSGRMECQSKIALFIEAKKHKGVTGWGWRQGISFQGMPSVYWMVLLSFRAFLSPQLLSHIPILYGNALTDTQIVLY